MYLGIYLLNGNEKWICLFYICIWLIKLNFWYFREWNLVSLYVIIFGIGLNLMFMLRLLIRIIWGIFREGG